MEGATHFIEQFRVDGSRCNINTSIQTIDFLMPTLLSTILTPNLKTVAVFKIKFKQNAND